MLKTKSLVKIGKYTSRTHDFSRLTDRLNECCRPNCSCKGYDNGTSKTAKSLTPHSME